MSPEKAHHFSFNTYRELCKLPRVPELTQMLYDYSIPEDGVELFGLKFKNRIGLAAGFDKDALIFDEFANFGFGHIEIGTVTPKAQPGNDQPRLFRLIPDEAILNRMGFNNRGALAAVERLKMRKRKDLSMIVISQKGGDTATTSSSRSKRTTRSTGLWLSKSRVKNWAPMKGKARPPPFFTGWAPSGATREILRVRSAETKF